MAMADRDLKSENVSLRQENVSLRKTYEQLLKSEAADIKYSPVPY